jgi:predicted RecB family endonuclease
MTRLTHTAVAAALKQPTTVLASGLDLKTLTNPDLQKVAIELFKTIKDEDENRADLLSFLMDMDSVCAKYATKAPSDEAVEDFLEDVGNMSRKNRGDAAKPAKPGRGAARRPAAPPPEPENEEPGAEDLETLV